MKNLYNIFGVNYYNLKYDQAHDRFDWPNKEARRLYYKNFREEVLQNKEVKIKCDKNTFSAKDHASEKFVNSEFFELMCESIEIKNSQQMVRSATNPKKMYINYDEYYGDDKVFFFNMKSSPERYVNKETHVCHVFNTEFSDERYRYPIYMKMNITRWNEVNVMSLHWGEKGMKEIPLYVYNIQTREYDDIKKVTEFLKDKRELKDLIEDEEKNNEDIIKEKELIYKIYNSDLSKLNEKQQEQFLLKFMTKEELDTCYNLEHESINRR